MSRKIKYTKEFLEPILKESRYWGEVFEKLGIIQGGANYFHIKNKIKNYNLDFSHFITKNKAIEIKKFKYKLTEKELFVENCIHSRILVKKLIYEKNIFPIKCLFCGQDENWKGKKISLILDHKNGINNDNRLENLRLLCPNCNATLDTHCNKNNKKK